MKVSKERNIMVIVQCAEEMRSNEENDDDSFPIVQIMILGRHYDIIDANCIQQPCYAVPYISEVHEDEERVIIVKPMCTWPNNFMNLEFTYY